MTAPFARRVLVLLVVSAILCGPLTQFVSPAIVRAEVERGVFSTAYMVEDGYVLTINSPVVTTDDVGAGAILIAQIVVADREDVNRTWACPVEGGWTYVTGVLGNTQVVQHLWWRHVTAPQQSTTTYTFGSREGDSCDSATDVQTTMTGAITLYTHVDTSTPIGEVASAMNDQRVFDVTVPATTTSHPAGSRIVRYVGSDHSSTLATVPESVLYAISDYIDGSYRFAAAFDATHTTSGIVSTFEVAFLSKARWVATTVVLNQPGEEPADTTAPVTSVQGGAYVAGNWTNASSVTVTLSAVDSGGSGVKEIVFRAAGDWTTEPGAEAQLTISDPGETTITFFARDNDGNEEAPQTFVVKIDRDAPNLSGVATTPSNANGWYQDDVEIVWQCSDTLSGVAGDCPGNSTIGGEGENLSASASVADNAGNVQLSSVTGIQIDRTAPVTAISSIPNWSNETLTVTLTPADNLSGVDATFYTIDDGPAQSGSEVVFDESGQFALTYWSIDRAGNREASQQVDIKVDTLAPTITHSLSVESNPLGWHSAPVTVLFECEDSHSGIASCSGPRTLSDDGLGQSVIGTAVDIAGNSATDTATVNIDQTAPAISAGQTPVPNANGWNNSNVVVSFSCHDALSGIVTCSALQTIGEGAGQQVTGSAVDSAGNVGTATAANLNVDLTAPVITASATTADGEAYLPGSWTNQIVTVTFTCSDSLSGIAICPAPQVFAEGASQRAIATVVDLAGNTASVTVEQINVDLTAPTISATLTTADLQPYTPGAWAKQPVTVAFQCADALSQVASCSTPTTFTDGESQSVVGIATDQAGNTNSLPVTQIHVDTVAPTIQTIATTADGQPYLSGTWTNQTVTVAFSCEDGTSGLAGSCPAPVVVSASTSLAGQTIAAQVSDLAGHTTTSDATTVKVDTSAPTFTFTPADLVVEAVGAGDTVVTWDAPVAVDDVIGPVDVVCQPASGAAFAIGTTTVVCTASDLASNETATSFAVTIVEPPPPVLTVPDDMTVPADGPYGALVDYGPVTSDLEDEPVCTHASGGLFTIGTTTVGCSVSNARGTTTTATFNITVLSGADLVVGLSRDTDERLDDPIIRRGLLTILIQVNAAIRSGDSERAIVGLQQYRMRLQVTARAGRISPTLLLELEATARQAIDALR